MVETMNINENAWIDANSQDPNEATEGSAHDAELQWQEEQRLLHEEPTEDELDEIELEPFDRDGWDDEAALGSAGFGMDESYEW